ncbi:MFS transporter [Niabella beijingensis]|uniref:MFS transporter n=1 Tax=Niabella beijingensis TaxID=2872700 RepID=UPI001CC0B07B|nr:MFS transporter [Niabella beijingensis]MBZ4190123.1 MFS transporter [Niabella beijingensis]
MSAQQLLKNNKKTINAWCWYDWANSSYSLVITSALFPAYFLSLSLLSDKKLWWQQMGNSVLYAYIYSFSSLLIMLLSPLLGALADNSGRKRFFMSGCSFIGAVSCMLLFFSSAEQMALTCILFMVSSICYSLGVVFYNAFIPEIATPDRYDAISARGFAWGYAGGMLALILNLLVIRFAGPLGFNAEQIRQQVPVRLSFVIIGLWWLVFAAYSINRLPRDQRRSNRGNEVLVHAYKQIIEALRLAGRNKRISIFLLAFFFYDMGVTTIMGMSSVFAVKTLHIGTTELIGVILTLQFLAILGSYLFVLLSKKAGTITAIKTGVLLWILICFIACGVRNTGQFYIMAVLTGLVMGGTQALSRSTFAGLIQDEQDKYATYFSLYDVLDKLGVVIGTFLFGWMEWATGSMRASVALLSIFFAIGFIFLQLMTRSWKK